MSASSSKNLAPPYTFGKPWPDFNEGITYTDIIKSNDSNKTLIDFYSSKYSNSAPFQGWLQRINNGQISIDGGVVTDPHYALRVGCEVVYCRLPWQEPDTPYLLEVLYEDDHLVLKCMNEEMKEKKKILEYRLLLINHLVCKFYPEGCSNNTQF